MRSDFEPIWISKMALDIQKPTAFVLAWFRMHLTVRWVRPSLVDTQNSFLQGAPELRLLDVSNASIWRSGR